MPRVRDRWFCYLLECADGTFYAGISNALDRRLAMHSQGVASKYTRTRLPVKLVYLEPQRDRASATRRELQIKKMSRADNKWSTRRDFNSDLRRDTEGCSASPRLRPENRLDRACQALRGASV